MEYCLFNCNNCCNVCWTYNKHYLIPKNNIAAKYLEKIYITLENEDLWRQFKSLKTEMIITKIGRQLFPRLQLHVSGLTPYCKYYIYLEFRMSSDSCYKYVKDESNPESGRWIENGIAMKSNRVCNSGVFYSVVPKYGYELINETISFKDLKISNNPSICVNSSNVLLQSRHKYLPRLWILKANDYDLQSEQNFNPVYLMLNCQKTFIDLHQTEFIAVTAYQNERITQLKVNNNPLAKGFREENKLKRKRKKAVNNIADITEKKIKIVDTNSAEFFRPWGFVV